MELYILRHGIATARGFTVYPNDDRPLTEEGVRKMKCNAAGIAKLVPGFDVILTSPLKRAHETASITAEAVGSANALKVVEQLLPGKSVQDIFSVLMKFRNKRTVLLVGHEPNLSEFASHVIGCSTSSIELKKGALCRIDVNEIPLKIPGRLQWHLSPKQLRMIGKS
jgi:phosphohistidine phosphatase